MAPIDPEPSLPALEKHIRCQIDSADDQARINFII
jgi:hypothetical protein